MTNLKKSASQLLISPAINYTTKETTRLKKTAVKLGVNVSFGKVFSASNSIVMGK